MIYLKRQLNKLITMNKSSRRPLLLKRASVGGRLA
ncbi:hypothetical protein JOC47_001088 [Halanaerobacter jeridensis]|uniref:Uncharacterized protein n=1 Tax=Halanaerobacter jeridensis TaxID=706427 RepID=A0A939BNY2_9FIRM|nr:hypothetical protein [Halanaerobacter jeridensis]